jgi:hypothetical protein
MAQELNQAQAVNVLIQAARIAQSKGAFTLEDAELVAGEDAALNQEPANDAAPVEPVLEKVEN